MFRSCRARRCFRPSIEMFRVLLFAISWRKLKRECPTMFDGHAARLGIEAALAEERLKLT